MCLGFGFECWVVVVELDVVIFVFVGELDQIGNFLFFYLVWMFVVLDWCCCGVVWIDGGYQVQMCYRGNGWCGQVQQGDEY